MKQVLALRSICTYVSFCTELIGFFVGLTSCASVSRDGSRFDEHFRRREALPVLTSGAVVLDARHVVFLKLRNSLLFRCGATDPRHCQAGALSLKSREVKTFRKRA